MFGVAIIDLDLSGFRVSLGWVGGATGKSCVSVDKNDLVLISLLSYTDERLSAVISKKSSQVSVCVYDYCKPLAFFFSWLEKAVNFVD